MRFSAALLRRPSARPSVFLGRNVRQFYVSYAVQLFQVTLDFVADPLRILVGIVFHFHLEKQIRAAHRSLGSLTEYAFLSTTTTRLRAATWRRQSCLPR